MTTTINVDFQYLFRESREIVGTMRASEPRRANAILESNVSIDEQETIDKLLDFLVRSEVPCGVGELMNNHARPGHRQGRSRHDT